MYANMKWVCLWLVGSFALAVSVFAFLGTSYGLAFGSGWLTFPVSVVALRNKIFRGKRVIRSGSDGKDSRVPIEEDVVAVLDN